MAVSKGAKIRNQYNQVPHLIQDTSVKVTNSQLDTTNESQEVSPFLAGDHKAHINRRAQRYNNHKKKKQKRPLGSPIKFRKLIFQYFASPSVAHLQITHILHSMVLLYFS